MATITITPSAAQDYQGSTSLSTTNHWIGRASGYSSAFTVRYTFKPTKKLTKIVAKITGTKYGTVDGKFRYQLSTSSSLPSSWKTVTTEGSNYLSITHSATLNANTTYYLFVTKETSGNYVYYSGCSASNVTITGTVESYTISYDANGGSGAPSSQTKDYGATLTISSTKPTRAGYTFVEWNTKQDGSGIYYLPGETYTRDESNTLYAQWELAGLVYIDNGTELVAYQIFIDNGSSWDQYMPYIDNGTSFDLYS